MKITVSVINDLVTDQRVHKVCTSLHQAGYTVTLIGRQFRNSEPVKRNYVTRRMRLLANRSFLFYAEYNIRLFFRLLFEDTDMLLANDTDTLPANYLVSRIRRKPLIFDAHEMFPEVPEVTDRRWVKATWTRVEDWIFPKLKYSYTVCQSIADIYNERYRIDMKVVRNIPFAKRKVFDHRPIDGKGKKVILYQGAVNVGRGIEQIMEAMPLLNEFVFYVVGSGDILDELKQKARSMQLEDRVLFTGRIPFEELPAYTACADIGVNILENKGLNYYYALPNRIFDFIRNNVLILANDFPEVERIVSHYQVGKLINHYEPEYLAEVIRELSTETTYQENFLIANNELTWENEAKTLLSIAKRASQEI